MGLERAGARELPMRTLLEGVEVERAGARWLAMRRRRAAALVVEAGHGQALLLERDRGRRAVLQHVRRQVASVHEVLRGEAAGRHQNSFPLLRRHLPLLGRRRRRRAVGLLASRLAEAAAIAVAVSAERGACTRVVVASRPHRPY